MEKASKIRGHVYEGEILAMRPGKQLKKDSVTIYAKDPGDSGDALQIEFFAGPRLKGSGILESIQSHFSGGAKFDVIWPMFDTYRLTSEERRAATFVEVDEIEVEKCEIDIPMGGEEHRRVSRQKLLKLTCQLP